MNESDDGVICIDLLTIPKGMSIELFMKLFIDYKIVFYDSYEITKNGKGSPPKVLKGKTDKIIVDVSAPDGKFLLEKILNEVNKNE